MSFIRTGSRSALEHNAVYPAFVTERGHNRVVLLYITQGFPWGWFEKKFLYLYINTSGSGQRLPPAYRNACGLVS